MNEWDYNFFIRKLLNSMFYTLNTKLDNLLKYLKDN